MIFIPQARIEGARLNLRGTSCAIVGAIGPLLGRRAETGGRDDLGGSVPAHLSDPAEGPIFRTKRPLFRFYRYKNIPFALYTTYALRRRTRGGMRRLGVVENIAHDGTVLVRSEFAPARGADVRDRRNRPLGRVVKVFGPVREPFSAVRPIAAASLSLIGADVFVPEGDHANKENRRGRRSH